MNIGRWSWAGQERYPGFCPALVRKRDPRTEAQALGAETLTVLTLAEAEHQFPMHLDLIASVVQRGRFPRPFPEA
ncbi:hypothetical protein FHG89_28720 [Micromonospora orduensis]|uniref:Uncharacterized protein n=1 Tax=Micromonospora orduensis TaxID=1420891 RepID=A0A5C4QBG8_9ACTN|nr:hypothetical protein [Micromonospora orduensis]TNH22725.1 hypothetical protein FHG89_28720 [Micromonospora orduensis]